MKKSSRLPIVTLLCAAGALLAAAPLLVSQPTWSRSRWIAEGMRRGVRFSGGVVPGGSTARLAALLASPAGEPRRGRGVPPGAADTRLSFDVLPPDGAGGAQPNTVTEPYLAVDPEDSNRMLALYQDDRFATIGGARALAFAVTTDGGRHWREGLLPKFTAATGGTFERASDPWVAFGAGHLVYCTGLAFDESDANNGVSVSVSSDGGATWADPVAVHQGSSAFDDKDAVAVDNHPQSPYFGRVYVGWDISPNDPLQPQTLVMAHSSDHGATFSAPATIFDQADNLGVIPLVDASGAVHAIWLHIEGNATEGSPLGTAWIDSSTSTDGGDSWSPPVKVADVLDTPVPNSRTGDGLPSAAIDPTTGQLFVVWQDQRFTPGTDQVLLAVSANGGSSWSAPRRVSDGPGGAASFTPAVAFNAIGQVAVSYYSFRNSGRGNFSVDEYMTIGGPHGRPFSRGLRQSRTSWDNRAAAIADGSFFLGDYQGLAAAGRGFFPLWIATFATSTFDPPAKEPDVYTTTVAQ